MISVKCPNADCPAGFQAPDEYLGKSVRCKRCNTKFKVVNTNGLLPKETPPTASAAIPATLYETTASFPAQPQPPLATPPQEGNADAARKRLYLYLGLGAAGVFSCMAAACVVAIGFAWSSWWSRSPETYGGIEISSTTVKGSVVKFYYDKEAGFDYDFLSEDKMKAKTDLKNVGPGGDLDPKSMDDTITAISTFFNEIRDKHHVPPDKIVIVFASGVFKGIEKHKALTTEDQKKQMIQQNKDKLRDRVMAKTKRSPEFVDLTQELELQIKSLIPGKEMDRALLVDLGNSNCRGGGYYTELKTHKIFNPKIGVEAFLEKAVKHAKNRGYKNSNRPEHRKILAAAVAETVGVNFSDPLADELKKTPDFSGRKRIELIGGIPWVTATYKNPSGRSLKHTKLSKQQIDDFYQEVRRDLDYPPFSMPKGLDDQLTQRLNKDVDSMEKNISVESLIAGTEMLKALSEELTFHKREVYFNNNGLNALVLGFMTKLWEKGNK